jgi:hypothetical protein
MKLDTKDNLGAKAAPPSHRQAQEAGLDWWRQNTDSQVMKYRSAILTPFPR